MKEHASPYIPQILTQVTLVDFEVIDQPRDGTILPDSRERIPKARYFRAMIKLLLSPFQRTSLYSELFI
jgi:hypothetical protein